MDTTHVDIAQQLRDIYPTHPIIMQAADRIDGLRAIIDEREREIGALNRHNIELRGAVDALLQPAPSELLAKNLAHPSRQSFDKVEHDGT